MQQYLEVEDPYQNIMQFIIFFLYVSASTS